ncbi:MAG: hypothetical protein H3Z52_05065 [archaeon]|nr:hypothetical protein [archaeon]MCP8315564.1 hypothetical protein [archaeon]MCP8320296.1 hypothetical protein [archaeon]
MPIRIRVKIIGFQPDSDPMSGEEYTQVTMAIRSPIPKPPMQPTYPPLPRPMSWKHVIHLFIPTKEWTGQYHMWQDYDLIIQDSGEIELKLAKEGV